MLTSLLLSVLVSAWGPAEPPAAHCNRCALMAQSQPPLPDDLPTPAPTGEVELQAQVDQLNRDIRGLNSNWPVRYLLLGYAGYVVAPTFSLTGGTLLIAGLVAATSVDSRGLGALLVVVGGAGLLIGLAGVAAIVWAWVGGQAAAEAKKQQRETLIQKRDGLEQQLRQLRLPPGSTTAEARITLAVF